MSEDSDRDDWPTIAFTAPPEDKELFDELTEHGEKSFLFRHFVRSYNESQGYDRRTAHDSRLEFLQEKLDEAKARRAQADADVQELEDEIELVRERRESVLTQQEEYEIALSTFERAFRAGEFGHVDAGHARIQELADEYRRRPDDVHDDLRDRNPDVPDHAFRAYQHVSTLDGKFEGLPDDQVPLPPDEREPLD